MRGTRSVQSYAGYRGDQEPRSFDLGQLRVDVLEITEQWKSPTHRYFKVRVKSRQFYILRHYEPADAWEATPLAANR